MLEVLVLYLDKLHHLGFGVEVVDGVVVGVGVVGLDVDVACLARLGGRWLLLLLRDRLLNWAVAPEKAGGNLKLEGDWGQEAVED